MSSSSQSKIDTPQPVTHLAIWVIDSVNKVIVVSKDCVRWSIPKGKIAQNETIQQAAIRIFGNLTGLDIKPYISKLRPAGQRAPTLHVRLLCDFDKPCAHTEASVLYAKAVPLKNLDKTGRL